MVRYFLFFLIIICSTCCSSPLFEPVDYTQFYPVEEGKSWVYEISETLYSAGLEPTEKSYFYKESIGKAINENTFILNRALSKNGQWSSQVPLIIKANPEGVTITDGNQEEAVIKYPFFDGASWQVGEENYEVTYLSYMSTEGEKSKLNRVKVVMANDSSAISLNKKEAIFEAGTGIIYRIKEEYEYCQENADCIGKGIISSGIKEILRLQNTTGILPPNNSSRFFN